MASDDYCVVPAKKSQPSLPATAPKVEDANDILRRRLLGLPELQQQQQQPAGPTPTFWNPADEASKSNASPAQPHVNQALLNVALAASQEQSQSQREQQQQQQQHLTHAPESLPVGAGQQQAQDVKKDNLNQQPDYAHTSVLKHLLHRYTGSGKLA